jgi:hypothetical protein
LKNLLAAPNDGSHWRVHMNRPPKHQALRELEPLNRFIERDETFKQLVPHRHGKAGTGTSHRPALAFAWIPTAADRRSYGEIRLRGKF